ncbi:hypothetical protein ACTMU2_17700 [Cupriavidus basilensis]
MVDPQRAQLHGYTHVKCNYELIIDNLADLSHAYFVHDGSTHPGLERTEHKVVEEDDTVYSKFHFPNITVPPLWNAYAGNTLSQGVDRWSEMRWNAPPICVYSRVLPQPIALVSKASICHGVHLLTPETASTTHYFRHCRGFKVDDPKVDEEVRNWQHVAFQEQDKPMLEAQQAAIGIVDNLDVAAARPSVE